MAAPITHIVLTNKVFSKHFSNKNNSEFLIGTSFPDIRYLGVIERDKTHKINVTLKEVKQEKSSFKSGLLFHSLVDHIREKFMKENSIYDLLPESPFLSQAIKIHEDQILFEKVNNWQKIINYFDLILPEERNYGINDDDLKKWHLLLQQYFKNKPTDSDINLFIANLGRPKEMSEEIVNLIKIIEKNREIKTLIENFYQSFDQLIGG